jgi:hypothetical protein
VAFTTQEYERPFAVQSVKDKERARRQTAKALMLTARHFARDADDFVMLADCLSDIELTEDQRRRLYEAMQIPEEPPEPAQPDPEPPSPAERMAAVWRPFQGIIDYRERETESVVLTALEIALERYGAGGEVFSANTVLHLLPEHQHHLAGRVIHQMRGKLEIAGEENSALPSRRSSKIRTYRLAGGLIESCKED